MPSLKFNELPIGKAFIGNNDNNVIVLYERIDTNSIKVLCFDASNGEEVLRATIPIGQGKTNLTRLDTSFWNVTVDGHPTAKIQFNDVKSISIDAKHGNRFVKIDTK